MKAFKYAYILALMLYSLLLASDWARADEITLAWDPNSEPDLAGYRLYGQTEGEDSDFRLLATIPLADIDPQAPQHTVFDLMPDTQYRFTITAYNLSGDESGLSNSVCIINGQQCTATFSTTGSGGCFVDGLNTPSVWKNPAPRR